MKAKMLVASFCAIGMSGAFSQSKFEGFYGQIGVGYENVNPSTSSSGITFSGIGTVPASTSISSQGSFVGVATLGYIAPITKDFLLGIGVDYEPLNSQSGNFAYNVAGTSVNGNWKKQNSYNIFLSPATPIGADALLYAKVGYSSAQIQSTERAFSYTTNLSGYMLGLGYKQIIRGGLYGFGEINYASYSNVTRSYAGSFQGFSASGSNTLGANSVNAVIGIGYRF
ncbi:hypothetical protein PHIN9_03570 [Polynucleobacter sp. HIN9]|uniref:outer membrane beta-barrel protein n=1 Tax=Polynucleobacter sp. HIN9 TaxID=3047868 RepID=UPI0025726EE3|nr:outer membrane beta-barrel protein [Polynucleobacter sp. HIN9]BEI40426.1 hypothetical protein PHIN9_03570 [Polynucleobacter sp. HIN9]